ncbi:hypothetical protein C8R47DRAFT_1223267 [Mycena vitilis]|nr:hypothetical protein C8R47DRAFT_1223267 [Mycena vitilis]
MVVDPEGASSFEDDGVSLNEDSSPLLLENLKPQVAPPVLSVSLLLALNPVLPVLAIGLPSPVLEQGHAPQHWSTGTSTGTPGPVPVLPLGLLPHRASHRDPVPVLVVAARPLFLSLRPALCPPPTLFHPRSDLLPHVHLPAQYPFRGPAQRHLRVAEQVAMLLLLLALDLFPVLCLCPLSFGRSSTSLVLRRADSNQSARSSP